MKKKHLFLLPLLFLLQACSWQEYFVIVNETKSDIIVTYEIEIPSDGFAIFDDSPDGYDLKSDDTIYWDEIYKSEDLDTSKTIVKVILHPKKVLY